jgi:hypothetical protein
MATGRRCLGQGDHETLTCDFQAHIFIWSRSRGGRMQRDPPLAIQSPSHEFMGWWPQLQRISACETSDIRNVHIFRNYCTSASKINKG